MDRPTLSRRRRALEKASGGPVHVISAATGQGLTEVLRAALVPIDTARAVPVEPQPWRP